MNTLFAFSALLLIGYVSGLNLLTSCGAKKKAIALTFDDGPAIENDISQKLLEKIQELGIVATFYSSPAAMGDDERQMQGRCEMIKKLVNAGMQIGLHNWEHEKFSKGIPRNMFDKKIGENLEKTASWLKKCGAKKLTQFRPPYGILSDAQAQYINQQGYAIAMWNVEPNDSEKKRSGKEIFAAGWKDFEENVGVGNSAVWSLHDSMFTEKSVDEFFSMIVQKYRDELGYEFVTMDQCYKKCGQGQCNELGGPKPDNGILSPRKK